MTNRELAASLSENALDLIKEILIRHECAVLGGAKQILADAVREERARWESDALRYRFLRQPPQTDTQITSDQLWGEELDASIDADISKEKGNA